MEFHSVVEEESPVDVEMQSICTPSFPSEQQ